MFNLVGKRYLFLIISLIVIVPGTLSLLVKGLNVGIDFLGGANIEFRPEKTISTTEMTNVLKPLNLIDLTVYTGNDASLPGNQTIWVRLNTQIDTNVQNTITHDLQAKYGSQLSVQFDNLSLGGNTPVSVATVKNFNKNVVPKISDIETALNKLPNTTAQTSSSPTAGSTPTAGTSTPTATATVKPTTTATPASNKPTATPAAGKGTPSASPTVTATPTPSSAANIPVKIAEVRQGTTTETITMLTRSEISQSELIKIRSLLATENNNFTQVLNNSTVSGSVASETTRNAFLAVVAAAVLILLYIWFSFRKVTKPWRYGTCAIIALLHDVLVVLGIFSILGWLFNVQVDSLFITALLTVVGFSVHDTIVVFDRIRENMQRRSSESFEQVVNASLVQTMARSLNTSLTVIFTLSALTLFGGVTIRSFTGALLVGIISGTYSSIFNASMLLVIWERGELGFNRLSRRRTPEGREARELVRSRG